MRLVRRVGRRIRDHVGPRGTYWAVIAWVAWSQLRHGWSRFPRECNICGYRGRFFPHGLPWGRSLRLDAGCPQCGALERHRLFKLWFDRNRDRIAGRSVLHFAPERAVRRFLEPASSDYVTADLNPDGNTDLVVDIEDTGLPGGRFGAIVCSHVLEHVDDRKALAELNRLLAPDGLLVVMTPVCEGWSTTYENSDVTDARGRSLHFGQSNHVRIYGADLRQRIADAGFAVDTFVAMEPEVSGHGLMRGETVFFGRKPH